MLKQNALLASGSKSSFDIQGWISTVKCAHHTNNRGISRVFTCSLAPYSLSRDAWVLEKMFNALVSKQGQGYWGVSALRS